MISKFPAFAATVAALATVACVAGPAGATTLHQQHLAHLAHTAGHPAIHLTATAGSSSFQACVIARESGGQPQVMNATGHYGLYQFAYGTWVAYGGSPSTFGHASVAQQNQVFANTIARGGRSNWSAYDGCLARVTGTVTL